MKSLKPSIRLPCPRLGRLVFVIVSTIYTTGIGGILSASAQTAPEVSAQNQAIAEQLYNDAMALMAEHKYAEACPKFVESNRLDTGLGTRFQLGDCYENIGKLASAWALFVEVRDEAQRTGQTSREQISRERAERIVSRLPKLTITVPPAIAALPGLEIRDNGSIVNEPSWARPLPVDPGEHTITATAQGRGSWQKTQNIKAGDLESIVIGELPPKNALPPPGRTGRQTAAIVVGSLSVASILAASASGIAAFVLRQNAAEKCTLNTCDPNLGYDDPAYAPAHTAANLSTVGFVVGGVGLVGTALLILWPKQKPPNTSRLFHVQVVPTTTPTLAGFMVVGAF